jgi:hypothetical protein
MCVGVTLYGIKEIELILAGRSSISLLFRGRKRKDYVKFWNRDCGVVMRNIWDRLEDKGQATADL